MENWLRTNPKWNTVIIPFAKGYEKHVAVPISSKFLLLHKKSQVFRRDCPDLPTPLDFWIVQATATSSEEEPCYRQLPLPTCLETDRLQLIDFKDQNLTVLLDAVGENNTAIVKRFKLEFNDDSKIDEIKFTLHEDDSLPESVEYKAPRPPHIGISFNYHSEDEAFESYGNVCKNLGLNWNWMTSRLFTSNGMAIDWWDKDKWESHGCPIFDTFQYTIRDCASNDIVSQLQAYHHGNFGIQAFHGDYILLPAEYSGEDAFYGEMRLFNWKSKELVKRIELPDSMNGYIEVEWDRGLLPNSAIFFVIVDISGGSAEAETIVCFYSA